MNPLLFPILFMIHDFEEIIWGHRWLKQNIHNIQIPQIIKPAFNYLSHLSTRQFTFAVMEEFWMCFLISWAAFYGKIKWLFIGIVIFYIIHCVIHLFQCIYLKRYIPLIISAIGTGAVSFILIIQLSKGISIMMLMIGIIVGSSLAVINLICALFLSRFI